MKERLDILLVREGFAASREKAKAVIMAGCVYVFLAQYLHISVFHILVWNMNCYQSHIQRIFIQISSYFFAKSTT